MKYEFLHHGMEEDLIETVEAQTPIEAAEKARLFIVNQSAVCQQDKKDRVRVRPQGSKNWQWFSVQLAFVAWAQPIQLGRRPNSG